MKPTRNDDAVVDLLDVILRDGVVVEADVIISVADIPLVGISLRAAIAGMTTMQEYGIFEAHESDVKATQTPTTGQTVSPPEAQTTRDDD